MIAIHGAWIAYKLKKLLDSNGLSSPDLVVVSPEQNVPKVFSSYLRHLMNVNTFIQIPDDILKSILADPEMDEDGVRKELSKFQAEWIKTVKTLTTENVLIFDEFRVSGGTLIAIQKILSSLGKKVRCFVLLVDFNPKQSAHNIIPTLSLYQIQRSWTKYEGKT